MQKNKFINAIKYLILPVLLYGILGPLEIYSSNFSEFSLSLKDFFWGFLVLSVVIILIAGVVISILPEKVSNMANTFVFTFAISSYIQGMFLNGKLIQSDGSDMDWSLYKSQFITNTIIWIAIFAICIALHFILKNVWGKISGYISIFISAVQIVTVVTLLITVPKTYNMGYQLDESGQFTVASGNNIIVLVLDRYGNERFEKVLSMYPEIGDCLKDFTYYNNADSRYSNTYPSMPHIMTGIQRDYSLDDVTWLDSIWKEESTVEYYNKLHSNDYKVHLYSPYASTCYGNVENLIGEIDNVKESTVRKDYRLIYALLEKSTMYRYAPYILKPRLEVKSHTYSQMVIYDEPEYKNSEFYKALKNSGLSIDNELNNCLMVHHILGLHNPFEIDENANEIPEQDDNEEVLINVTRGLHVILAEYLNQLKELGVYDNATIIITADHGDYFSGGGLQPIYFIKAPYEVHDDMKTNSAPISHDDFVPTILYFVGEDYSDYGTTIFDWNEGDKRARMIDDHVDSTYYTDRYELYKVSEDNSIDY